MKGMLNVALEEIDEPLYYVLDEISSVMHSATPNHDMVTSAIINANYQVSYSHCQKNSIKTNAPTQFVWDVLRQYIATNPIKERWLVPEHRVFHIMQKAIEHKVDFTLR
jgi:tRNA (guanine26-N2/guanine27-N2)-dimethyltransferase